MTQVLGLNSVGMETIEKVVKHSPRKKGAFTAPFECSQILSYLSQFTPKEDYGIAGHASTLSAE